MKSEYLFYVPPIGSFGKRYHGEFSHWCELELEREIVYWCELELERRIVYWCELELETFIFIGGNLNLRHLFSLAGT